ncbi:MAG: M3 family metallopeptidase [Candidatus Obscuribacterales bacterium]|nr:M3 family metallopeptidase [Candidatus Obscuribacterales bacterium]
MRRTFLKGVVAVAMLGGAFLMGLNPSTAETTSVEPFLDPWTGARGGTPRFDLAKTTELKPAILKGMDLKRKEIQAIVDQKEPPTFQNTIAALEDCGRPLSRAMRFFDIYTSTMSDKAMQSIESDLRPQLAKFDSEIIQNDGLFQRIKTVYESREKSGLNSEQKRVTELYYTMFKRQGAGLDQKKKARLREINERLATLFTNFGHNQLADEEKYFLVLENESDLAGLPESLRRDASAQAETRNLKGKWVITNTRSLMEPFITVSSRRDLREKGWRMWTSRGDHNDEHDNKATISEILKLRAERAQLLGFASHAHWILADNMAKTPDAALDLMMRIWKSATERVKEEVAEMQAIADKETEKIKIEPWDYRYYAELVRKAKYDIDQDEVKQYLPLDKVRDGMFYAAKKVYGLDMRKIDGLPTVHPDVEVYEVSRGDKQVGLWYFDPYARDGKRSGAWMNEYRTQENFREPITPIVSNNSNFNKGKPGEPVLISLDDATTMFHEFGHALHGLQSSVAYPSLAGTNVKRDFVELPSQVNERWALTDEVLNKYALHYQTGKPIPPELVAKLRKAKTFNMGFHTTEYLAAALYDMKIHLAATPDKSINPGDFERVTMTEIGCPKEIVMRHRPTQFGHIFSDDGYSAGYYSYIWADTYSADAAEAFEEVGSFYDRATCDRFRDTIFCVGNSVAPEVAFRNFRGRDVDTNALMRDRGFPVTK